MMKLQAGDRVKFLNSKGGGIIKRIIDSRMALVTIDGGFDIPTLITELLKITDEPGGKFFEEKFRPEEEKSENKSSTGYSNESFGEDLPSIVIRERKTEDVYFAFRPHDQQLLVSGVIDLVIINNTSADLLYSLFRKNSEGGYLGADYGSVPAGSRHITATINRDALSLWIEGTVQFLFHKEECSEVPDPFNAEYSVPGKKFFSESSYKYSQLISGRAAILKVATLILPVRKTDAGTIINPSSGNNDNFILKHKTSDREAEVDLHIHELLEDSKGMPVSDILEYQKNYFMRCLESAIVNHFRKVIFIHGVGNGVLRNVLLDYLLKQKGIDVFDAPMSKYGVGAVEVRIRHNI